MKRAITICLLLLSVQMLFSSCASRKYKSYWVGNRGHYVVRRHGILPHFPWGHKHYGRRVRMKAPRRFRL